MHLFKLERLDSNDTSGMDSCTLDSKITRLSAHVDNPHHHHCHHHHHHHLEHDGGEVTFVSVQRLLQADRLAL